MALLVHMAEKIGLSLIVGIAGLIFAIPAMALIGFAVLAAGWFPQGLC